MNISVYRRVTLSLPLFALFFFGIAISPTTGRADALAQIRKSGVMTIGNSGAFPPFEFVANGKLVGYDIDLGNEIAKRMGVKAEWKQIDFSGIIAALTSKRVDILVTAMVKTPQRAARIAFSDPYFNSGIAAAFRPGEKITKPSDLAGKIVAVQVGTAGEQFVRDHYAAQVKEIRTYDEFLLAVTDVEAGRADVVVNTLPPIEYNVAKRHDKLQIAGPWDTREVGINTRLGDKDLLDEINRQLVALRADGFLKKLNKKWFGR